MDEFQYHNETISSCANHIISGGINHRECENLFERHQAHYERDQRKDPKYSREIRYQRFLESVLFVNDHNSQPRRHRVVLNRFSDMLDDEIPLYEASDETTNIDSISNISVFSNDLSMNILSRKRPKHNANHHNHLKFKARYHPVTPRGKKKKKMKYFLGNDSYTSHLNEAVEFKSDPSGNQWKTQINWSNGQNPDGVPLVHPPIDQGK